MEEINTKEIFDRVDLQQIRSFILNGTAPIDVTDATYDERLQDGNKSMLKRLHENYKNNEELSDARNEFYYALTVNSNVMFELGMKIGAKLMVQLLYQD